MTALRDDRDSAMTGGASSNSGGYGPGAVKKPRNAGAGWSHRTTDAPSLAPPWRRVDIRPCRPTAGSPRRTMVRPPRPSGTRSLSRLHPCRHRQHDAAVAHRLRQRATVADQGRDAVDHRLGRHPAKRLVEHRGHQQQPGHPYRSRASGIGGLTTICGYRVRSRPSDGVQPGGGDARLHDQDRDIGARPAQHVGQSREQCGALVQRRIYEGQVTPRALSGPRHFGPHDRRRQRRAVSPMRSR